jgi:hypothetical protein
MLVGFLFVAIVTLGHKLPEKYSAVVGAIALMLICFVVAQLEKVYKDKSWYGPSFSPPNGYIRGPLSRDQGNNI